MMSQAQLLQCPDCGHRHDLAALGDVHTFRCDDCGRALKVPPQFRDEGDTADAPLRDASAVPPLDTTIRQPAVAPVPEPVPQRAADSPRTRSPAAPATGVSRRDREHPRVPIYWRLLIWLFAIPVGLVLVFQVVA